MLKVCKLKEIKGKKYRCYFELALLIIGGKWKPVILFHLAQGGVMRFSELRRGMPGVTERMLARQLRELEKDGLVSRQVFREVPPRVEYRLTPQGCAVIPALIGLREWGVVYERHLGGPGRFAGGDYESPDPVAVNPECLAQAELVRQGVEIPSLPKAKAGRSRTAEPKAPAVEPEAAPEPISEPNQESPPEAVIHAAPPVFPTAMPEPEAAAGPETEAPPRASIPVEPIPPAEAAPGGPKAQAMHEGSMPAEVDGTSLSVSIPEPLATGDMEPEAAIPAEAPVLAPAGEPEPIPVSETSPEPTPAMVPAPETAPAVVPETPLAIRPEAPAAVFLQPVPAVVPAPPGEPEPEPAPKPERSGPSLLDFV